MTYTRCKKKRTRCKKIGRSWVRRRSSDLNTSFDSSCCADLFGIRLVTRRCQLVALPGWVGLAYHQGLNGPLPRLPLARSQPILHLLLWGDALDVQRQVHYNLRAALLAPLLAFVINRRRQHASMTSSAVEWSKDRPTVSPTV